MSASESEISPFRDSFGFDELSPFNQLALEQLLTEEIHVEIPLTTLENWRRLTNSHNGLYIVDGIVAYTCNFSNDKLEMDRISVPQTNMTEREYVELCRSVSSVFLREMVFANAAYDKLVATGAKIATAIATMQSTVDPKASYMKLYVPYAFMDERLREAEPTTPEENYATDLAVALFHYNSNHHLNEL